MKKLALLVLLGFSLTSCVQETVELEEDRSGWLCKKQVRDLNHSDKVVWKVTTVEHEGHSFDQIIYLFSSKIIHTRYTCQTIEP